jgi:hypothetical protein
MVSWAELAPDFLNGILYLRPRIRNIPPFECSDSYVELIGLNCFLPLTAIFSDVLFSFSLFFSEYLAEILSLRSEKVDKEFLLEQYDLEKCENCEKEGKKNVLIDKMVVSLCDDCLIKHNSRLF